MRHSHTCEAMCDALNATHCNLLQLTAIYCNSLQLTATYCNTLTSVSQCVCMSHSTRVSTCNTLTATHCNLSQHTHLLHMCVIVQLIATCCNLLQHAAIYCNTLQLTATRCNLLQHIYQGVSVCVPEPLHMCVNVQHTDCNTPQLTETQVICVAISNVPLYEKAYVSPCACACACAR